MRDTIPLHSGNRSEILVKPVIFCSIRQQHAPSFVMVKSMYRQFANVTITAATIPRPDLNFREGYRQQINLKTTGV